MWNYKNILRLFPIAIVIVIIVFFESTSKNEREIFTESSLNNMIMYYNRYDYSLIIIEKIYVYNEFSVICLL